MQNLKENWRKRILSALEDLAGDSGVDSADFDGMLTVGTPPKPEMGDIAFPFFPFAKAFKTAPPVLANQVADKLRDDGEFSVAGPYLNLRIPREPVVSEILRTVESQGDAWGKGDEMAGRKVMIEFSSPNTNKPLHLGHLRNDILGVSCARLLAARGAEVQTVNMVNDRGVHICKSMLAYRKFGAGETPESRGVKPDRFVGDWYVRFAEWSRENPDAEKEAQEMLRAWEADDPEVRNLWKKMNGWALEGIGQTYDRTGVTFDKIYRESETYVLGKQQVTEGLNAGVFYRDNDGSVRIDMSDIGLDTKVLLRSDGTAVYITQDLGTAVSRHADWPFDDLIYVVGSEQEYHFRVLFHILGKLGYHWAERLRHLSYGMVNLPDGKMKSREGTVVDADDLIDELAALAAAEITAKGRETEVGDVSDTAEKIALAALHYFLLQVAPTKDMIFDPKESLSFNGDTGPYLQYMTSRVAGLIDKAPPEVTEADPDPARLSLDQEWALIKGIAEYPEAVSKAAASLDPSLLISSLHGIARDFSRYYHEVPIVKADDPVTGASRLALARAVLTTLRNGFTLLNIPYLEAM